jgi:hypothetical protein
MCTSNYAYLDDIWSPAVFGANTRNSDSFSQPFDEVVLQAVHLLKVCVEARHLVELFVDIRPSGVWYAIWGVLVVQPRSCNKSSRRKRSEASANTKRAYYRWISRCYSGR